jgi:hypothetical protein
MTRNGWAYAAAAVFVCISLHLAVPANAVSHLSKSAASIENAEPRLRGGGNFSFTVEPVSPSTAMDNDLGDFLGPYFYFLVTNTGDADTYDMLLTDLDDPINWWPQVCVGTICIPGDSSSHSIGVAGSDTLGLNVVANTDGVDQMTFTVRSQGNPSLSYSFQVTLYAGNATVDVQEITALGAGYELRQNSPNPVRAATSIRFAVPHEQSIELQVYDVSGRVVRTLSNGVWPAGSHSLDWDGRNGAGVAVPAGVYFYRLVTAQGSLSKRLTVIR